MADKINDVFLSYSRQNKDKAKRLFNQLRNAGISVWMDEKSLTVGDRWRKSIFKEIDSAAFFLPLLSSAAFSKDSFFKQEVAYALQVTENDPKQGLTILPVRLDECEVPLQELADFHFVDLFPSWDEGFSHLMKFFLKKKKMQSNLEIVGFDLGHGETAIASTQLHTTTEPRGLDVVNGQYSILTAVALTPDGILIGDDAYEAQGAESLDILFKGRNVRDPSVGEPLQLFIGKCLELLKSQGKLRLDDNTYFFVGRPSGWTNEDEKAYEDLLRAAGMTNISVRPESRAAFLDARETGSLIQSDNTVPSSVLIVDIGSSTTDFTWVTHTEGGLEDSLLDFGNNRLGGGLIDKAIFAYACAHIPENQTDEVSDLIESAVNRARCIIECRHVKEKYFSKESEDFWVERPAEGSVRLAKRRHFYIELYKACMERVLATPLSELGGQTWPSTYRKELIKCRDTLAGNPPELVMLTGGASRMAFTHKICGEVFPNTAIRVGAEPHMTIAKGLALVGRIDFTIESFREEVNAFVSSRRLGIVVREQMPELSKLLAKRVVTEIETATSKSIESWSLGKIRTVSELKEKVDAQIRDVIQSNKIISFTGETQEWLNRLGAALEAETYQLCDKYKIDRTSLNISAYRPDIFPERPDFVGIIDKQVLDGALVEKVVFSSLPAIGALVIALLVAFPALFAAESEDWAKRLVEKLTNWDMPRYLRQLTKGSITRTIERAKIGAIHTIQKQFEKQLLSEKQVKKIQELVREHLDKTADQAALVIRRRDS